MSTIHLEEPLTTGGIQAINFFNGRLLSGEDLTHEQLMNLLAHRRLGRAVGAGVSFGLEVKKSASQNTVADPVLSVTRGLAVNGEGQTLWLQDDIDISVVRATTKDAATGAVFGVCEPAITGVSLSSAGFYLLTIAPAGKKEGKAPVSGLGNVPASCNSRYTTLGVQFQLMRLSLSPVSSPDRARNEIAYQCFDLTTRGARDFVMDPLSGNAGKFQALEALVEGSRHTACHVPLAVIEWRANGGLGFVDMWAVRRRITKPDAEGSWIPLLSDRRLSEAQAMFFQFQAQIDDILNGELSMSQILAKERFAYLPPAGLLPIRTGNKGKGFDYNVFLSKMTYRKPIFIEGAQLRSLLQDSFDYAPIDTSSNVVVWLYLVRENAQLTLSSPKPPQAYLVFASGHTPYRGEARYDVNHWNFGNFA